jgi:hypothetical protein
MYRIADLADVRIFQIGGDPSMRRYRAMGFFALAAALLTVPVTDLPVIVHVVVLCGLVAYAVVCLGARRVSRWQLVALHRREVIVLFDSADQREFDQVARGLLRAMQYGEA